MVSYRNDMSLMSQGSIDEQLSKFGASPRDQSNKVNILYKDKDGMGLDQPGLSQFLKDVSHPIQNANLSSMAE